MRVGYFDFVVVLLSLHHLSLMIVFPPFFKRCVPASRPKRSKAFRSHEFGGVFCLARECTVRGNWNERGLSILICAQTEGDTTGVGTSSYY